MAKWAKRLHDRKRAAKQGQSNGNPKHKVDNGGKNKDSERDMKRKADKKKK